MKVAILIPRIHRNQTTRLLIKTINLIEAVILNLIYGTSGIRTHTERILSPMPLPLGYCPFISIYNIVSTNSTTRPKEK